MLEAFRNNLLFWIGIATPLTVISGLLIAVLADRSKFERTAKSLIFMPMAISFVGASVIWNFIYEVRPAGAVRLGCSMRSSWPWAVSRMAGPTTPPLPLEQPLPGGHRRLAPGWVCDGTFLGCDKRHSGGNPGGRPCGWRQRNPDFFRIMIPYILGTIITVTTTIIIFTLKIFDVVWVMTGGQFGTDVIATQFYRQSFIARNAGYGSAIAIVLLLAVIPVMIYNLRQFREQEGFR